MRIAHWILPLALISLSVGCAAEDAESGDGLTQSIDNGDASKADSLSSTATYYTIRHDFRKCISPVCGGWWVKRVNFTTTLCANGSSAAECYVSEADFSPLKLSADELASFQADLTHSIVRGVIGSKVVGSFGNVGKFRVTEGWAAAATATAPVGYVYNVKDNGVRCITFPCFSLHEAKLNSTVSTNLSDTDFSESDASADQVDAAQNALAQGILLAGANLTVPHAGPAGTGKSLVVSQIYFRAKHVVVAPGSCGGFIGTQCASGQFCDITIANACNGADLPGVCVTPGQFCTEIYKPVCGCDGHTYSNECFRQGARVQLAHVGPCN